MMGQSKTFVATGQYEAGHQLSKAQIAEHLNKAKAKLANADAQRTEAKANAQRMAAQTASTQGAGAQGPGPAEAAPASAGNQNGKALRIVSASDLTGVHTPPMTPAIIDGLLREGHKMIISGGSKAGKTWLLYALALDLATGRKFLDTYQCRESKVLLVNTEIDENSHANRLEWLRNEKGLDPNGYRDTLDTASLRGERWTLTEFVDAIIERGTQYKAVLLDSIYKLYDGNENDNSEVSKQLFTHLDRLTGRGVSVVFVHHDAKGAQMRQAIDRASGAGMFARDPDAIMNIADVRLSDEQKELLGAYDYEHNGEVIRAKVRRINLSLREFGGPDKLTTIFRCPLYQLDTEKEFTDAREVGSDADNGAKGGEARAEKLNDQYRTMDEEIASIVAELEANGEPPTRANVLPLLNEAREQRGWKPWLKRTFADHTRDGGRLGWRVEKDTNRLVPADV